MLIICGWYYILYQINEMNEIKRPDEDLIKSIFVFVMVVGAYSCAGTVGVCIWLPRNSLSACLYITNHPSSYIRCTIHRLNEKKIYLRSYLLKFKNYKFYKIKVKNTKRKKKKINSILIGKISKMKNDINY
jgi:hypothetical protein